MINLRVKIESNGNNFNFRHELADDYNLSKENADFQKLVQADLDSLHLEHIEDVTLYIKWDW